MLARQAGLPAVAVLFDTDPALCRRRNRDRNRPVPAAVLDAQLRKMPDVARQLADEGWDLVVHPGSRRRSRAARAGSRQAASEQRARPAQLEFILQISRFGWGDDPAGWLRAVTLAAADAGFAGIALMDHLIQIPQVGRAWDPIPEPWVTLGLLAGLDTSLRLGTLVTPVTFRAAGLLAKTVATLDALCGGRTFCGIGAGWWEREHAAFGLAVPAGGGAARPAGVCDRDACARCGSPAPSPIPGDACQLAGDHVLPPAGVADPDHRRRQRRAAHAGIAAALGGRLQLAARTSTCSTTSWQCCAPTASGRPGLRPTLRSPYWTSRLSAGIASTSPGSWSDCAAGPARRRSRAVTTPGLRADHVGRYRQLAERGVSTVFVALPDLAGPDDLGRLAPIVGAFG